MSIITRESKGSALTHAEMDANLNELNDRPNGQTYPSTSGVGLKLDTLTPEFGWHDLVGFIRVDTSDTDDATREVYRGNIKVLRFDETDEAFIDFHMPHDYLPGSNMYIHAHWSHNSSVVTGGSCTWGFEVTYAKGYDRGTFDVPVVISVAQNASLVPYTHSIAETIASAPGGSAVLLDTDLLETDGIIHGRISLDSNDITTSDASVVRPFVHFVDIHYQSTALPTKGRNYPFYT